MSRTIAEMRARLQQLNTKTAKKPKDIWKATDEHDCRLLPYPHSADPILELHFHYDIGGQSVLCPRLNFGKECVICDFCDQLKSWKGEDGEDKPEALRKQDWELFKKIQPKVRMFVPMVERGKEAEGARFWGISPTTANKLIEMCTSTERLSVCDVTDPDQGLQILFNTDKAFDVHVSFKKKGEKGNTKTFDIVDVEGKIMPSKLAKTKAEVEKILATIKNIHEVYPEQSPEEVNQIFMKFVGSAQPEAKPEGGTEKYGVNSRETGKVTGGKTIDDAFDDLDASV